MAEGSAASGCDISRRFCSQIDSVIEDSIEPGSTWIRTAGRLPCRCARRLSTPYQQSRGPFEPGCRVAATRHQVFSLLNAGCWERTRICRRGTPSGLSKRIRFRFNRRKSRSRGKLFYRLVQQPSQSNQQLTDRLWTRPSNGNRPKHTCWGNLSQWIPSFIHVPIEWLTTSRLLFPSARHSALREQAEM